MSGLARGRLGVRHGARPVLARALAPALLVGPLLVVGCEADPIVLARIPMSEKGTRGGAEGDAEHAEVEGHCFTAADCKPGSFCEKRSCGDLAGDCMRLPARCAGATDAPVCGCDGITYFDDCLRRAAGVESARPGTCDDDARLCGGLAGACPAGAVCTRLTGLGLQACLADVRGACWVLPAVCPPATSSDRWHDCAAPGGPCVDTCSAARSERPFGRATRCE